MRKYLLSILLPLLLFIGSIVFAITLLPVPQGGTGAGIFTDGYVLIGNGTGAIEATSTLVILDNKNVGVNTTTPEYALDVDGAIQTDTAFYGDYWISSTGNSMNIQPTGDTDDFFSFKTPSNRPTIKREGGKYIYVESSNVNDVGISFRQDADHSGTVNYYKDENLFGLTSKDPLVFKVCGDYDDYVKICAASNIPELSTIGSADFKINAGGANDLLFNHSGGNVGIATTTPAYILDVYGNVRIDGNLITNNASTTQLTVSDDSWLNTIKSGIWNGTALTDTYVSNTLTIDNYMQDTDIDTFAELQSWAVGYTDNDTTYPYAINSVGSNGQVWKSDGAGIGGWGSDNNTTYTSSDFTHDDLTGFVANEHIDWTGDQGATNIHSGNYTDTNTQLSGEEVDDYVNALIKDAQSINTRITITYDDTDNAFDFVVDDMNDDVPESGDFGNAGDLDADGTITDGVIDEADLDIANSPTDEYVLTYESDTSNFQWVALAGGGDITDVFNCTTGDCNQMTVGTSEYLAYGAGYIDANRFAGVTTVDATEFGYLNDVSSAIQTQFSNKQPLDAQLTDIADGTFTGNFINTAHPWADNEVSDTLTCNSCTGNAATCTTASAGDAAVDFFGAGVDAVTDATTCTNIEGTGLSITTGTLNWSASGIAGHDSFSDFVANEHLDWTGDLGATNIHAGNYTDTNTTYLGGTNLTLADTIFNVDDAFLINSGSDIAGGGSGFTWTFDASAGTDSVFTFGDGTVNLSTGALQVGGTAVLTSESDPNVDSEAEIEAITGAYFGTSKAVTSGYVWIADGTDFESVVMSGDATIASGGALTISASAIEESMLNAVDAAGDEECLTWEAGSSQFEWQACGGSIAINDITDITITTPADNEVLAYNNGTSTWINQTPAEAGLQGVLTNSAGLRGALSDESGTGVAIFGTAPSFTTSLTTPAILTGNVALTIGDATTDSITFVSDGTGNAEFVFPADVIGDADIDWGAGAGQVSGADITFAEGDMTNSTIISADIKDGTITVADTAITAGRSLTWSTNDMTADAELFTTPFSVWFEDPTADDDFQSVWYIPLACTVKRLWCESDQTVNMTVQEDDGSPADIETTDLVCDSTPADNTSGFEDSALAAGSRIDLAIASVSGTPTWVSFKMVCEYND